MSTRQALQDALTILEDQGWTQGCHARRDDGASCCSDDPKASSFCISAALWMACDRSDSLFAAALQSVKNQLHFPRNVSHWNDAEDRTFGQVREILRRAAGESSARDFFGGVSAAEGSGRVATGD